MPGALAMVLADIDVDVVRIEVHTRAFESPQYVFAVHPLAMRMRPAGLGVRAGGINNAAGGDVVSTFIGSTVRPVIETELPVVHEVTRTYSQCRKLYRELLALTNSAKRSACQCARYNDSDYAVSRRPHSLCSCRALFPLLDAFMFPRKRLLRRRARSVLQERQFAFNLFIKSVLQKLQLLQYQQQPHQQQRRHRGRAAWEPVAPLQRSSQIRLDSDTSSGSEHYGRAPRVAAAAAPPLGLSAHCQVVTALLRFLALDSASAVLRLFEASQHQHHFARPLNLDGWRSDHKNLYAIDSAEAPYHHTSDHSSSSSSSSNNSIRNDSDGAYESSDFVSDVPPPSSGSSKYSEIIWGVWSGAHSSSGASSSGSSDLDERFAQWLQSHHGSADSLDNSK